MKYILHGKKNQEGVSLFLTLMVVGVILTIALAVAGILAGEIRLSRGVSDSIRAIYASDAGAEKMLYHTLRLDDPINPAGPTAIDGSTYEAEAKRVGADIKVFSTGTYRGVKRSLELTHTDSSLMGYWPLDGIIAPATVSDFSVNAKHGTAIGGPLLLAGASCKKGGCLEFNGTNYVRISDEPFFDFEWTQPYTLLAWIRTTGPSAAVMSKMTPGAGFRGYDLFYIIGGNLKSHVIETWADPARAETTLGAAIGDSLWHQVAVTYDGTGSHAGIRLYIDGAEWAVVFPEGSGTIATILNNSPFIIGSRDGSEFFVGRIDEVRVYKRVLTATEISGLFNSP